jgi:hypothetical protein
MKKRGCFWAIASWGDWVRAKLDSLITGGDYAIFQWACAYGSAEDMQRLLADPTKDPKGSYTHPVYWAIEAENVEVLRVLLEDGRDDPSKEQCYNFSHAIRYRNDDITRIMYADVRVYSKYFLRPYKRDRRLYRRKTPANTQLGLFLERERIRQSLCVAWFGAQVGHGWKDLMCDILVQYIGAQYETGIQ